MPHVAKGTLVGASDRDWGFGLADLEASLSGILHAIRLAPHVHDQTSTNWSSVLGRADAVLGNRLHRRRRGQKRNPVRLQWGGLVPGPVGMECDAPFRPRASRWPNVGSGIGSQCHSEFGFLTDRGEVGDGDMVFRKAAVFNFLTMALMWAPQAGQFDVGLLFQFGDRGQICVEHYSQNSLSQTTVPGATRTAASLREVRACPVA